MRANERLTNVIVDLEVGRIDPTRVRFGRGSLIYVEGTFPRDAGMVKVELRLDESVVDALVRAEVAQRTRFSGLLELGSAAPAGRHEVTLRVSRGDAGSEEAVVGIIDVLSHEGSALEAADRERPWDGPLIAICMATREPRADLLERQISSIKAQSFERFVCIIVDDGSSEAAWERIVATVAGDERFVCVRSDASVGFYRNFERCLELVPAGVPFVALADQDDIWHADKLAVLTVALEPEGVCLAFSDMNIVTEDGQVVSPTYWVGRSNNFVDLSALLLMNTVTGASMLFRRELLGHALPFPPEIGRAFHDHWLACVALAYGEIAYVDKPLYDYVQHAANEAGSFRPSRDLRSGAVRALGRLVVQPRARLRSARRHAGTTYHDELVRLEAFGRTLELRFGTRLGGARRRAVRRAARAGTSGGSVVWLLAQGARETFGRNVTLGVENHLLEAIAWRRFTSSR